MVYDHTILCVCDIKQGYSADIYFVIIEQYEHIIFLISGRMTDTDNLLASSDLPLTSLCQRWFKTTKKARKEFDWQPLYSKILYLLLPDINPKQLLVSIQMLNQNTQILLSSLLYAQEQKNKILTESLSIDVLILLAGTLSMDDKQHVFEGPTNLQTIPIYRNEKTIFRVLSNCKILRCEKKQLQKFRNEVLREDRQNKQSFLSRYLFCELTPVYPLNAVKLLWLKEGVDLKVSQSAIKILQRGLIGRRSKKGSEGSHLTTGCIIDTNRLAGLLQIAGLGQEGEETFNTLQDCMVVTFSVEELARIIKLNPALKKMLDIKLKTLFDERLALSVKNQQLSRMFNTKQKMGSETVRMHYSIEFKSRPRTACVGHSFRRNRDTQVEDGSLGDFITFNRYEKMIASKQRVAANKAGYQFEARGRAVIPIDYEKKMKMQNKMLKIQSGKIKKIGARDSKVDSAYMRQIKKNLCQVTHIFDEPIDTTSMAPSSVGREQTEIKSYNGGKMGGIRPEQFLKEEYLNAFLRKSQPQSRHQIKDIEVVAQSVAREGKQNLVQNSFGHSDGFNCLRRTKTFKCLANKTMN